MLVYLALVAGTAYAFVNLPEGFLPVEDQGFFTVDIQTPARRLLQPHPGGVTAGSRSTCWLNPASPP